MKCLLLIVSFFLFTISANSQTASVIAENANLRGTPSEQGKVIDTISIGKTAFVLMQKGVWFLLQTDDYVGWVHGNTIKIDDPKLVTNSSAPVTLKTSKATSPRVTSSESRTYIRGSRGGCYYINANGKKTYVDRSVCN